MFPITRKNKTEILFSFFYEDQWTSGETLATFQMSFVRQAEVKCESAKTKCYRLKENSPAGPTHVSTFNWNGRLKSYMVNLFV